MTPSSRSQPETLALLRELAATPRPTGSEAIAKARERCARELRELGFAVTELPFEYSQFPGRFGTPLIGAAAAASVGIAGALALTGQAIAAVMVMSLSVALLAFVGWLLVRDGTAVLPLLRARGVNLQALSGEQMPTTWLVAHLDTKSQPIPSLLRALGTLLEVFGFLMVWALTFLCAAGYEPHEMFWYFGASVTILGAIPVMLSVVGTRSPGALDNASGVVAVIEAVRHLSRKKDVGVLITDAEELGLAGARAWQPPAPVLAVLNCDGIDDSGDIQIMFTGEQPEGLTAAIDRAALAIGVRHNVGRMFPGILTDSIPFANANIEAVTFSRGTWRSLLRVHSRRDDLEHLSGTGIAQVAKLMTQTVNELRKG